MGPIATFPITVFQGISASAWKTKLVPRVIPWTCLLPTETSPALGVSRPETSVNVVDFPQPVGPTIAQNCPGSTTMLTSWIAVNGCPSGVRNRLVTPASSIRASTRPAAVVGISFSVVAVTMGRDADPSGRRCPDCHR